MSIKGLEQSEAIAKSLDRQLKRTLNAQKKRLKEENVERDANSQDLKQKAPDASDSDEDYTLKCTVTSRVKTYR